MSEQDNLRLIFDSKFSPDLRPRLSDVRLRTLGEAGLIPILRRIDGGEIDGIRLADMPPDISSGGDVIQFPDSHNREQYLGDRALAHS